MNGRGGDAAPPHPAAPPTGAGAADHLEAQWSSLLVSLAAHRPQPVGGGLGGGWGGGLGGGEDGGATVPVTILTGFLGSGKSTLLARLLADPGTGRGRPVRAVVNDVGSLAFDPTLVASVSADGGVVELTNGCGCCVAGAADELGRALERAAPGAGLVVLEASGLADPAAMAQVATARPGLRVARTVAVVDARAVERLLGLPGPGAVLRRQLASATVIVVSHADGLGPADRQRAVDRLAEFAPGRPITTSTLDHPAHRALTPEAPAGAALADPAIGRAAATAAPGAELVVTTVEQPPLHRIRRRALQAALAARPPGLLRGKGRLRLDDGHVLVQLTPSAVAITPTGPGPCAITLVGVDRPSLTPLIRLVGRGA